MNEVRALVALFESEGMQPWVGRMRDRRGDFVGPLTPVRFLGRGGPTWTTHYVCCVGDLAYDPIVGEPVPVATLGEILFGRTIAVEAIESRSSE